MDIEAIVQYAHEKVGVEESFPFGEDTLVFKAKGKIFMLASLNDQPLRINLKCEPNLALDLREEYPENILPGYHMNKKHWNTIILNSRISAKLIFQMIDQSYLLVTTGGKTKK